jgi:hypothetical protein
MLLLSYPCFAQTSRAITTYQYRQVPENKIAEFIRRETTYFSEVAKKATEKGNLQFWALLQKVGGQDGGNSPNFLFINTYNDIDAVGEVWGSAAALFPKVPAAQMETNSMSKVIGTYFLSAQAWEQSAKAEPKDYKFIKFNYMTSSNPAGSIGLEKKHWQPFIKKVMDNGQTPQVAWGNAILLSPVGEDVKFNLVAYDIFPNLKEALNPNWDEKTEFPVDGLTEIGKLEVKPRSGEVYQIIKTVSAAPMAAN